MTEKIQCSEFELVCPKTNKVLLTMKPADGGAGIWIDAPDGKTVAIFAINGQTGVGIYSNGSKHDAHGMPICLMVDDKGNGCIQIRKGDKIKHVGFDDL